APGARPPPDRRQPRARRAGGPGRGQREAPGRRAVPGPEGDARRDRPPPAPPEAVAHVESAEHEPNAVIEEHQPGYRLHERLLRPALVTVAKGRSNLANPEGGD